MKEIDKIIKSKYPPKDKNVLWDNGENLMINRNGKWESANKSSSELPDSFKNWSGAANFLNNNDEPGGMINMPFGYSIRKSFTKHIVSQTYHERLLIGNISDCYYYGNIVVALKSYLTELNLSEIANVEVSLITGYIYYDSNTHDIYFITPPYPIDNDITVSVFAGKKTLSKEFIDLEIDWQNNNQDSTNYIKNRTHFIEKANYVTLQSSLISSEPIRIGTFEDNIWYGYGDGNDKILPINRQYTSIENAEWTSISAYGPPLYFALVNSGLYVKNIYNNSTNIEYRFYNKIYHELDEDYIPDTIARVADYELPHITFYEHKETDNLELLSSLTPGYNYTCDLYSTGKDNIRMILENGEYFNGTITGINNGKLVQYDINFETGAITEKLSIDLELIGGEVKLDVCTAGSTEAARNLELLNKAYFALGDHFTVNIDAGIGVAKFIPESGGEGHITTAAGVNVHYTIGNDGSVVKTQEIDIVALYNKVEAITSNN